MFLCMECLKVGFRLIPTDSALPDPPRVSLHIGRGLDPRRIREGQDVYFTCKVSANPPPIRVIFFHQVNKQTAKSLSSIGWTPHR